MIKYKHITSPIKFKKWRNSADSSNVDRLMYNDENRELVVKFNSGDIYTYFDIDFEEFANVFNGQGICRTTGSNKYGSWFLGKFPSVGAAVFKYLVDTGATYKKGGTLR